MLTHKEALELLLKRVDYNAGHCGSMEAISSIVPHWVLRLCNEALEPVDDSPISDEPDTLDGRDYEKLDETPTRTGASLTTGPASGNDEPTDSEESAK
jgi:hypothetical protein